MKVTLEPTGLFQNIVQEGGPGLRCRIWEGRTDTGAKIVAHIPLIAVRESATLSEHAEFDRALRAVKAERELVSFDIRIAID